MSLVTGLTQAEIEWFVERVTYPDASAHHAAVSYDVSDDRLEITLKGPAIYETCTFSGARLRLFFARLRELADELDEFRRDADFDHLYYDEEFFSDDQESE